MKILLTFLLLALTSGVVYSQKKVRALYTPVNASEGYVNIPGTRVMIEAPKGFRLATTFRGIENGSAVVEVYDLVGGAFDVIARDFSQEMLTAGGASVFSSDQIEVNGFSGLFSVLQHQTGQKGMALVFGDNSFSVIAIANFPDGNLEIESQLRCALLNIRYGSSSPLDGRKNVVFRLDDSRSPFHYAKTSANTLYYEQPGQSMQAYLAVCQLSWDYSTEERTISELLFKELTKHGVESTTIRKSGMRKINGFRALEAEAVASHKGGSVSRIYQLVVLHGSHAIVVHGISNDGSSRTFNELRRLARTLEFD